MPMIKVKYGNTNTFYCPSPNGGLLVDTDYAGTMVAFYKVIKKAGFEVKDISYVLATHYHPDHMGLIGQLMNQGVKLLLIDVQKATVHYSDGIFTRGKIPFVPVDEDSATVIFCDERRDFLARISISGEIIHTPSHSPDSVSLILDDGDCIVGDLEPMEYLAGYEENEQLKSDWDRILSFQPKRVFYGHAPEKVYGVNV